MEQWGCSESDSEAQVKGTRVYAVAAESGNFSQEPRYIHLGMYIGMYLWTYLAIKEEDEMRQISRRNI